MPRTLILSLFLSAFLPAGCGASKKSADVPPSLIYPCQPPQSLPDGYLSDREVEIYWLRDRKELLDCAGKVHTLGTALNGTR